MLELLGRNKPKKSRIDENLGRIERWLLASVNLVAQTMLPWYTKAKGVSAMPMGRNLPVQSIAHA